jgi:hypothetical protein
MKVRGSLFNTSIIPELTLTLSALRPVANPSEVPHPKRFIHTAMEFSRLEISVDT